MRFLQFVRRLVKGGTQAHLRPVCPICERPMERRASTVWMCPEFPRCPGSLAATD
jgi:ribosomal protein L37AE/L43A